VSIWEAIVLGIVQGITEFLPISSSGHLILVPWLFGWDKPGLTFNVGVHIGTFAAVIIFFRRDLFSMAVALPKGIINREPFRDPMSLLAIIIILGSIPAAIVGLLMADQIEAFFHSGDGGNLAIVLIACALIAVGLLMYVAERRAVHHRTIEDVGMRDGLIIGLAQALALIPGVSRSGSTITAGLFLGLRREAAARFSFLLGVPAVLGAAVIEVRNLLVNGLADGEAAVFAAGILTSLAVGYISIAFLLRFLVSHTTMIFIIYRVLFGILVLSLLATGLR
jgi:undecaprenyl-diphosphatase